MSTQITQEVEYFIPMNGAKYNRTDLEISNYGNIRKNGEPYIPNYIENYGFTTRMQFNSLNDDGTIIELVQLKTNPVICVKHLVAYYFIPNELNHQYVRHIDGNNQNLFYKNLQWMSENEKNQNAYAKRQETNAKIKNGEIEHKTKIIDETDNMDPNNFVSIGSIQIENTIRNFSAYSISKDGKTILNRTGRIKSKLINKDGYVSVGLVDANKGNRNPAPVLIHKLINVVLKEGNYDDQVDHIDQNKTNNSLDNLEPVTAKENSIRANGVSFYKINPDTMQIIESYRCISEAFTDIKVQKMIIGSFHNKRIYDSYQWRRISDEGTSYTIENNTIIDMEQIDANNLEMVNKINDLLQFKGSCLSISTFIGGTENYQTFHCSEYELDMQVSWDNLKSRNNCYYCNNTPKDGIHRVLPIYKYYTDGTFICEYNNIIHAMDNDSKFADGYQPKHTSGVMKCCLEKSNTAYGYKWSFYKPTENRLVRNLSKMDPMTIKRFQKIGIIKTFTQ